MILIENSFLSPNAKNSDWKQKCQGTLVHHKSSFISKGTMAIRAPCKTGQTWSTMFADRPPMTTDSQKRNMTYQKLTTGRHDAADFATCIWKLTSQQLLQINCGPCLQSGGPSVAIAGLQSLYPWPMMECHRDLLCGSIREAVSVPAEQ